MIVDTCEAINEIGYNGPDRRFKAAGVSVLNLFSHQAADIACGVGNGNDLGAAGQLCRPECKVNHGSVSEKSWQMNKTVDK